MVKYSNEELFRMVSLLKGCIRSVKDDTPKITYDDNLSYEEKLQKLEAIENECVEKTLNFRDVNKDFISGMHNLLLSYKIGTNGRESAYRNFISQFVDENESIDSTIDLVNHELIGEYDHAIRKHKFIIK